VKRPSLLERKIKLEGTDALALLGLNDANLQIVEKRFDAHIVVRGETITIKGESAEFDQVEKVFK